MNALQQWLGTGGNNGALRHRCWVLACFYTSLTYYSFMLTVIETPIFLRYAAKLWDDAERDEFIAWLAEHDALSNAFLRSLAQLYEE
jgi:hypothetical protein